MPGLEVSERLSVLLYKSPFESAIELDNCLGVLVDDVFERDLVGRLCEVCLADRLPPVPTDRSTFTRLTVDSRSRSLPQLNLPGREKPKTSRK
jgi:hypothetical protein